MDPALWREKTKRERTNRETKNRNKKLLLFSENNGIKEREINKHFDWKNSKEQSDKQLDKRGRNRARTNRQT